VEVRAKEAALLILRIILRWSFRAMFRSSYFGVSMGTLFLLIACGPLSAQEETQTFDSEESAATDGWMFNEEGQNPERICRDGELCETNLGWKDSDIAGGADAGEGGGLVHRSGTLPVGFYADTTIGELTLDMPISASGKVSLVNINANGHYHFGFFDGQRILDDPLDAGAHLGFFFSEPKAEITGANFRWGHSIRTDSGVWSSAEQGWPEGVLPGESLDFSIDYDPSGDGTLTLEIGDEDPWEVTLPSDIRNESTTLTAFGIWTAATPSNASPRYVEIFLDDITYTSLSTTTKPGDYNNNGLLDAGDLDQQAQAIAGQQHPQEFDLNNDGLVNFTDREMWIDELKNTWIGDANLDGEFNSSDMVQVFARGKYEKPETAGWEEGDFNGDTFFDSGDMVAAFVAGGYEKGIKGGGPNPAVSAVPEPTTLAMFVVGILAMIGTRCRRPSYGV
jgi:hypothetical protein